MSKDNGDKSSDLNDDFELLKRVWLIERFSPEILNFHEDLLSKFFSIIKSKVSIINFTSILITFTPCI